MSLTPNDRRRTEETSRAADILFETVTKIEDLTR
jgi:hypothetical protein